MSDADTPYRGLTQGIASPFLKLTDESTAPTELKVFERDTWQFLEH